MYVGGYYSDPYTKVDGQDGTREYGVSAGFGFPLFQSKSILNISGQYVRVSPKVKGMLEENYLKINIGLTFNERWFMKWKVPAGCPGTETRSRIGRSHHPENTPRWTAGQVGGR